MSDGRAARPTSSGEAHARELEARIQTLRRELAGVVLTLSSASRRLDDLLDEVRANQKAGNVIVLERRPLGRTGLHPDILGDFLE